MTAGFAVSNMGAFSPSFFAACEVLVIPATMTAYTAGEVAAIQAFVESGGGLFLLGDWSYWSDGIYPIASVFGYTIVDSSYLGDTDDYTGNIECVLYDGANLHNHSLTLGVTEAQTFYGSGFSALPSTAQCIITTDTDGTSDWNDTSPADGVCVMAASTHELGRVVMALDFNWLDDNQNLDGDGTTDYFDSDNAILGINTIRWLSAAGLKERNVLFDESHNPLYEANLDYLDQANYLTSNGYTIYWMSTFHTSLLDTANILVICDGTITYTAGELTAIDNFVAAGGGLFLLGDWGSYGDKVDPIGNLFSIDRNDTGYIMDSDDTIAGDSYNVYDGANIGTHPITQGVTRIEIDRGGAFDSIGTGTALVSTDTDGTAYWSDGGLAIGLAIMAATTYQLGRVVYITDLGFFKHLSDGDGDGDPNYLDSDNNLFTVNAFQWLAENRAPIVTVTSPNGAETLIGTVSISWTAVDPNKDAITSYDVYYSDNNGGAWHSIATGLTTTSTNWDTTAVSDGDQYLIRVVAHDYELNGQDQSDAVFSIDNVTPTTTTTTSPPPIPGFPIAAVALGLLFSLGLVFVMRRKRRYTN